MICQRRSDWATAQRARLYRFVELIGYWSMLDVIVVALVSALVHFGALSSAARARGYRVLWFRGGADDARRDEFRSPLDSGMQR